MKYITNLKKLKVMPNVKKSTLKILALLIGAIAITFVIYETYRYFSKQSEATTQTVNYSFTANSCTTSQTQKTCTLNGKNVNDTIEIDVNLEAVNSAKISGADLIFAYNIGEIDHMEYLGYTPLNLTTEFVNQTHASPQPQATRLLHLAIVNTGSDSNLFSQETIRLRFKVLKPGTSRVTLITSGSTIVGPESADAYVLSPQNGLKNTGSTDEYENIYNVSVNSNSGPTLTPTGTQTITPPPTGTVGKVELNIKVRFQGITQQPRNTQEQKTVVKLISNNQELGKATIDFAHTSQGIYLGTAQFDKVNTTQKYALIIKGPKHIAKKICVNNVTEVGDGLYNCTTSNNIELKLGGNDLNFSGVYLLGGDLPIQNGVVDSVDIALLRSNLGKTDTEALQRSDINMDNIVDTQDYALLITALSFKYDE